MAAEDTEASLKGLPNAKTTRYIEMGKSEMEVSGREVRGAFIRSDQGWDF